MNRLVTYLDEYGILSCNVNKWLPCLSDIGCSWSDVTAAIDENAVFYCKAYRNRTVYLSPRCCYLLKKCRAPRVLSSNSLRLLELMNDAPPVEKAELRRFAQLASADFDSAFNGLLRNMDITAIKNGRRLTDSWSEFLYGTARSWEQRTPDIFECADPNAALRDMLIKTMSERELASLIGR